MLCLQSFPSQEAQAAQAAQAAPAEEESAQAANKEGQNTMTVLPSQNGELSSLSAERKTVRRFPKNVRVALRCPLLD
jgi:hypothetical protein